MIFCHKCESNLNINKFSNTQLKKQKKLCKDCTIKPQIKIRKSEPIIRLIGARFEKPLYMKPNKLKYHYRMRDIYDFNRANSINTKTKRYSGLYKSHLDYKYYYECKLCKIKKAKKDFSLSAFRNKISKKLVCKKCVNFSK